MRIMLIDDSQTMRNIQKSILTQLGEVEIEEAADGRQALGKVRDFAPELLLVDWNMPGLDGPGFVREYRLLDPATPVIVVATEAERPRVVEALTSGVTNYIIKPFTPDLFAQRIEAAIAATG
jgi:two-component system, chemotaxis family, chemotaxis protein CheY